MRPYYVVFGIHALELLCTVQAEVSASITERFKATTTGKEWLEGPTVGVVTHHTMTCNFYSNRNRSARFIGFHKVAETVVTLNGSVLRGPVDPMKNVQNLPHEFKWDISLYAETFHAKCVVVLALL